MLYFKADDIGFFDFVYEDFTNSSMINVERHVFYRDIYVFIDKFKDFVNFKKENKVREILFICFRDNVFI